jgi:purine nucleoside permease
VNDGDLCYEIDAREIPPRAPWTTGRVPYGRSTPYERPYQRFFANGVQQIFQLNGRLVDFAV